MKLLYTNFHTGDGGGHTTYIRELAAALAARHEVHVAAPPGSRLNREARELPGVRVLDQPFPNGLKRWRARRRARTRDRARAESAAERGREGGGRPRRAEARLFRRRRRV